ncbi:NAD-dependent protein deacetylase [Paraburkholderia metrosideri]|uniref:NAD-dependent protein deacetylase n=1 Tax=Paraburkholderia metrosideri TaxID=580937 RepID=A0ABN7HFV4_9BURK|nr:hypothetical protein [Paraburkholderia metrosideri]CAD6516409.1 NAD-dependent protein deacetylase [Paraburkholderia metrosideri]
MAMKDAIRQAAEWLRDADGLLITAGAGMGVDSGMPDFRGTEGFWRAYLALGASGIRFEEVASPQTFRRDPNSRGHFTDTDWSCIDERNHTVVSTSCVAGRPR